MRIRPTPFVLAVVFAVSGCSGGSSSGVSGTPATAAPKATPTAAPTSTAGGSTPDLTALPLDDGNVSTSPRIGYVYSCTTTFGGGGSSVDGPWIDTAAGTFNLTAKIAVQGSVSWSSVYNASIAGSTRAVTGNGLPSHTTGIFPISSSDPAYAYDHNPNHIAAQSVADSLPANPVVAASPSCLNLGPIGVMVSGAQLFNALDGEGRDAQAHEVLDSCDGHPDQSDTYHYHGMSACISDPGTGHSNLIGYALDGFGIFGPRDQDGTVLSSAKLDACHGHTHAITWNGATVTMYHYHMTYDYPYSLGCYTGTPISTH
jgi:hypothetical protein